VVHEIENRSDFRFLYRDGLIAGKRVSFEASASKVLEAFDASLAELGLSLEIDLGRGQVLIISLENARTSFSGVVVGTVVNGYTSDRLPHATVTWRSPSGLAGVATNQFGRFALEFDSLTGPVALTASYVGFESSTVMLNPENIPEDLPFRLRPSVTFGSEVIVSSPLLRSTLDSTWYHLTNGSRLSPLGESSVLRSLQLLPSVSMSTAMTSGLNVRGTRTDGFQVLLDGISIYRQSHLFGLFDALNSNAIQAVDFYYDVTPARLQGPPGGTLSYITRSGSRHSFAGRLALTNTSASSTFEGPISDGRGSWLLSARRSYMNAVNWFNNEALIATGLNVGRNNSGTRRRSLDERTLFPGQSVGSFYDLHGKLSHETAKGARFYLSAYAGGDDASHDAQRIVEIPANGNDRIELMDVVTSSAWNNIALSIRDDRKAWGKGFSSTSMAFSHFQSEYRKDDFIYRIRPEPGDGRPIIIAPFENDNRLTELKLSHETTLPPSATRVLKLGASLQNFQVDYEELSALRKPFSSSTRSSLLDVYGDLETSPSRLLSVSAGLRTHYFTQGSFLRLSPRLQATLFPQHSLSFSAGYSRTYQFLHRLYVENTTGSDIWVLSSAEEPPGAVDHLSAGLKIASGQALLKIDGYAKWHENLRRHQTVLRPGGTPGGSPILSPWVHDNESRSYGLETLGQFRRGPSVFSVSYTLSRSEIRQQDVNDGNYFPADWDRLHQATVRGEHFLPNNFSFDWNWTIGSGRPNYFSFAVPREQERLGTYHRLDLSAGYTLSSPRRTVRFSLAVYNAYNRDNVWYRAAETVLRPSRPERLLAIELIDVYDLGIQPSFRIEVSF